MYGWTPLFADRYPYGGALEHYVAYMVNADGYEVELVAGRVLGSRWSAAHENGPGVHPTNAGPVHLFTRGRRSRLSRG